MANIVNSASKTDPTSKRDTAAPRQFRSRSRDAIASPIDHLLFLQRTIGNQAVKSGLPSSGALRGDVAKNSAGMVPAEGLPSSKPVGALSVLPKEGKTGSTLRSWRANSELWYFNGEPQKDPLPTEVSLQADARPAGTFLWSITDGVEKVEFVKSNAGAHTLKADDNRVGLKSKGASNGQDDVSIRASHIADDGTPSGTYEGKIGVRSPVAVKRTQEQTSYSNSNATGSVPTNSPEEGQEEEGEQQEQGEEEQQESNQEEEALTQASPGTAPSAAPKQLRRRGASHFASSAWGYESHIYYRVLDDKGKAMKGFDVNEQWTTGIVNDNKKANWRRGPAAGLPVKGSTTFFDRIGGESKGFKAIPKPKKPQKPLGSNKVQHWGQDWYIGSTSPGKGTKVQSNILQKYQDHAVHTNIKSPP